MHVFTPNSTLALAPAVKPVVPISIATFRPPTVSAKPVTTAPASPPPTTIKPGVPIWVNPLNPVAIAKQAAILTPTPTSVGPQVPTQTMPPSGYSPTDQGYSVPINISTTTDGGGGGGGAPSPASSGINWGLIGLAAAALGALALLTG